MEVNRTRETLKAHLVRSQSAYKEYLEKRTYFSALRIRHPNKAIVNILQVEIGNFRGEERVLMIQWMNHIEAWLDQFRENEKVLSPALGSKFVFERIEGAPEFPSRLNEWLEESETDM